MMCETAHPDSKSCLFSYFAIYRFDPGGTGSCLRRYSDPTFFRRASSRSEVSNNEKSQRERKARKNKVHCFSFQLHFDRE